MKKDGKKIDTWKFHKDNDWQYVELRLSTNRYGDMQFTASCPAFDLEWTASDVNALKKTVEQGIKDYDAIPFDRKLVLTIRDKNSWSYRKELEGIVTPPDEEPAYGQCDSALEVHVKRLLLFKPDPMSADHGDRSGLQKEHPTASSSYFYWPKEDGSGDLNDDGLTVVLDDTLENQMAIQEIMDGIGRLKSKLKHLLHPDRIGITVRMINASGVKLLPAKEGK